MHYYFYNGWYAACTRHAYHCLGEKMVVNWNCGSAPNFKEAVQVGMNAQCQFPTLKTQLL